MQHPVLGAVAAPTVSGEDLNSCMQKEAHRLGCQLGLVGPCFPGLL